MKYSIEDTTLTGIADALRRKHGETEIVTITAPTVISKSHSGASGFDSYASSISQFFSANIYKVINIPNSTTIYIKIGTETQASDTYIQIASGSLDTMPEDAITLSGEHKINYYCFENTDTITIHFYKPSSSNANGLGYYAEIVGCDANGNPVGDSEVKETEIERKRKYKSSEIAGAIEPLDFIPESAFVISGDCQYKFSGSGWNWFLEQYNDKINTKDITNASSMFTQNANLKEINFDFNFKSGNNINAGNMFNGCEKLIAINGNFNNFKPTSMQSMFNSCQNLRYLPNLENIDFSYHYTTNTSCMYLFQNCYSLRSVPETLLKKMYQPKNTGYYYSILYSLFYYCYVLDEIRGLNPQTGTMTSNLFSQTFPFCNRLKNIIFAKQDDGTPYIVSWKAQTIDLTTYVGYASSKDNILNFNSGITADKEVTDDASYQALKDDPDWFTTKVEYSRYNHDSAVATINSLPDTSAYLASAGGTNTIKFKGAAGSATDGGAINALTEQEIAVATAKGWTVSLV